MHVDPTAPQPPQGEWWSDEPPMENYRHLMQMIALITTLRWLWRDRSDYFVGGNLTVYYSQLRRRSEDFRGPDFFVALGVDGTRERRSWVVWEEGGRYPDLIIELLSPTTEAIDRGEKMRVYEQIFRTPEYFLFDPETETFEGYRLVGGRYVRIDPDPHERLASEQLGLLLGVQDRELRYFTLDGVIVPTPDEGLRQAAEQISALQQQADDARQQAGDARRQADDARQQAGDARQRAADAEQRAARAEAELASLRTHDNKEEP